MSNETWKLEKDLCRCCHSEGSFKNLSETSDEGQEVYSDMLQFALDINVLPVAGMLCCVTYTICEQCSDRLRDAVSFKRQVLQCEERFRDMYDKDGIKVLTTGDLKVKEEVPEEYPEVDGKPDLPTMDGDDSDDFPLNDLNSEEIKQEDPKKSKPKKAKQKKKLGRPKKTDAGNGEKKGEKTGDYYVYIDDRFTCKTCGRSFSSQPLVSQHYRFVHLKRRPRDRKCPYCDQRVPGYLRAYHLEEAHNIPAPKCGVCNKKFRYPHNVLQHQKKVHMGEKTVICQICDKGFFSTLSLRLHMTTHNDAKRFKCSVCGREFRWLNNLKDHLKIHTGDKRYVCKVCAKAFVQKSTLKQHGVRNHPGVDVF
ncbi:zinc finger protein 93-like isoform X4 [Galleria mellonella]|uniref:Zinc finger protein 93-like isoform X4 n=1 Tax=Galleria mellonella TaxID=7137 RepID=A0ABM3N0R2_GALME|nr:zinc finger protein 93-like isoform X4 [Galleria mellonella]